MRHFTMIALISMTLLSAANAEISQGVGVVGFQAWKTSRVEEAKLQLEKVKAEAPAAAKIAELKPVKSAQDSSRMQKGSRADQRLEQAQLNVEIAEELSVNDYFVLYLNQFKDRSAFLEAAQKLNSTEAADLMMAYQKHLASAAASDAGLTVLPGSTSQSPILPETKAVRR